jgi:hypothetical protein
LVDVRVWNPKELDMKRWMALLMMAAVSLAAWALPTVDQVQAEVAKGNYAAAEVMMRDVIAERPNSARAQYVLAQVLAHNGRLDDARTAAQRARQLDPAIGFTSRQGFEDFERALAQGVRPGVAPAATGRLGDRTSVPPPDLAAPPPKPAVPGWAWGIGGAVVAILLWRLLSRRRGVAAAAPGAAWGGRAGVQGVGAAPATRSGMLGAGLAGAGGFAAGMLADRLLRGDGVGHDDAAPAGHLADAGDELSRRSIDFGGGGNDWSSDGGGGGGSDGGGGGDW